MKSKRMLARSMLFCLTLIVIVLISCHRYVNHNFRQSYTDVNEAIHSDTTRMPFFKIHFKNGDVSVLDKWDINERRDTIIGQGKLYDFNRLQIEDGNLSFAVEDIAILETNQLEAIKSKDKGRIAALSVLTGANVVMDVFCITNPKACFGSCPTFYVDENSSIHSANAEGFSSSTAPSFEKKDLDPLQFSTASGAFFLTMKNEALETHVVNELFIEAVLKNERENVYVDKNNVYYISNQFYHPTNATVGNIDIRTRIARCDDLEYFSTTDSTDLFAQEEIILEFDDLPKGDLGITLNYRQSLLTTFLFYNGISYMGDEAVDYVAKLETDRFMRQIVLKHYAEFGRIKVSFWDSDSKKWKFVEEFDEKGPIAKNLIFAPILNRNHDQTKLKVKLELTKGLWRLDYICLNLIESIANPIRIYPTKIEVIDGAEYTIEDVRADDKDYLISFPGNEFKFKFELPEAADSQDYEMFLSSKGYYLEWIRQEWIKGKNIVKLKKMLLNDPETWRELAREFKAMEHEMESVFWNSNYSRTQ